MSKGFQPGNTPVQPSPNTMTSLAPLCTPDTLHWFLKADFGQGLGISASGSNTKNRAKPLFHKSEQIGSPLPKPHPTACKCTKAAWQCQVLAERRKCASGWVMAWGLSIQELHVSIHQRSRTPSSDLKASSHIQQGGKQAEKAALWHCSPLAPEEVWVAAMTLAARVPVDNGRSTSS